MPNATRHVVPTTCSGGGYPIGSGGCHVIVIYAMSM